MDRPARTFVLPVPLSRMVAPYATIRTSQPNIGTAISYRLPIRSSALNGEIKRRTEVVGIFPDDAAIIRLVGAIRFEQNDEWAVQRARYITLLNTLQMDGYSRDSPRQQ